MNDLFAGLDQSLVAGARHQHAVKKCETAHAIAIKRQNRHQLRRINAEAHLAEILPAEFTDGESWHVISRGDIDSLSFLRHVLNGVGYLDHVLISSWCIAKNDLTEITGWLDTGKIEQFDLFVGEIFPGSYGAEYEQVMKMRDLYGCKLIVAKNHSKVMLAHNRAEKKYIVIESSANVNTNPRIEQSAIHCDKDLYTFYMDFFNDIKSIDKSSKTD